MPATLEQIRAMSRVESATDGIVESIATANAETLRILKMSLDARRALRSFEAIGVVTGSVDTIDQLSDVITGCLDALDNPTLAMLRKLLALTVLESDVIAGL